MPLYSIIDIETTGLSPRNERITEIAIMVHDGEKLVDEFTTLLDPEVRIPYRITQLTGINDKMVQGAPRFCEIARHIVEMTEGTVLVGHNVHFDYHFIRKEFGELGYDYRRPCICTAKLSRRLLPGRRSYALGKLCEELNIHNPYRHRAFGDAQATLSLFVMLLRLEHNLRELSLKGLNTRLDRREIDRLPETTGVYYFHNDQGEVIYVGKSINIRERVLSHLTGNGTKKAVEMREQIAGISTEVTGSELVALLLESHEIKQHAPLFNRAGRRAALQWGIYVGKDDQGYLNLVAARNDRAEVPLTSFGSATAARNHLFTLAAAFGLCQKLCGLYQSRGACFQYAIRECRGACTGEEPADSYNIRVLQAVAPYRFEHNSFLVIDRGRHPEERSVIGVENGRYLGFGYLSPAWTDTPVNGELRSCIRPFPDHRDSRMIILGYLKKHPGLRIIPS
ncbi:MAG: GIY-YIG nuclease family protein [Bacteroidales bacterium]|nr:GIY-YIG nuclease family protein [Bacteroidales bacterium]